MDAKSRSGDRVQDWGGCWIVGFEGHRDLRTLHMFTRMHISITMRLFRFELERSEAQLNTSLR